MYTYPSTTKQPRTALINVNTFPANQKKDQISKNKQGWLHPIVLKLFKILSWKVLEKEVIKRKGNIALAYFCSLYPD